MRKGNGDGKQSLAAAVRSMAAEFSMEKITEEFLPFFSYAQAGSTGRSAAKALGESALNEFPIYGYCMRRGGTALAIQDEQTHELLLREQDAWTGNAPPEGPEQADIAEAAGAPEISEPPGTSESPEGADLASAAEEDLLYAMEQENRNAVPETLPDPEDMEDMENLGGMENMDIPGISSFLHHEQTNFYDWEALREYKNLVATFYAIDAGTMAGSDQLNIDALLSEDVTIDKNGPSPQILIYHTHSLEAFSDSVPGDRSQTIVGVGDRLAQILTEEYGYGVLHHTEEYDTVRDDAYAKSLPALKRILEENPSIQVVIDLHRDAGLEGTRRAIDLDGRPTATFMLFNGLSRTRKTGDIAYLKNPNQDFNLALSFQMQVIAGEYYPGLTRKIYLKAYRYNMHLMPRSLLIELGDSNNTVEEAMNTCDPLAHILDMVLSGENGG